MSMIVWQDDYSVGLQEIDEQHKCLINLINQLYEALAAKQHREQVAQILEELVDYTLIHFAVEETLMRLFDYPEYAQHKQSHDGIAQQVREFQRAFRAGQAHLDMELLMFLKNWLTEHISKVDKRYAGHLSGHGVMGGWLRRFW
jgi:hemerythrin